MTDSLEARWQIYSWSMCQHCFQSQCFTKGFTLVSEKIKAWLNVLPLSSLSCSFPWGNLAHTPVKERQFQTSFSRKSYTPLPGFVLASPSSVPLHSSPRHPTVQDKSIPIPKSDLCPYIAQTRIRGSLFSRLLPISMSNYAFAEILIPVNHLSYLPPRPTVFSLQYHMWLRLSSSAQPPSPRRSQVLRVGEAAAEG